MLGVAVLVLGAVAFTMAQTVFEGGLTTDGAITGTTITATTGFVGDVTGDMTGKATGEVAATDIAASGVATFADTLVAEDARFMDAVICNYAFTAGAESGVASILDTLIAEDARFMDAVIFNYAVTMGAESGVTTISDTLIVDHTARFMDTVIVDGVLTATGGITGVTGTIASLGTGEQGNLPAAGDHDYEFYINAAADTLWMSDSSAWQQIWP